MELWKLLIATWIFVLIGCESIYLIMASAAAEAAE